MSSKSEREKRRAERLAAEKAAADSQKRRLMLTYVGAGVLTLVVVVGLVLVLAGGSNDNSVNAQDFPANAHIQPQSGSVNGVAADDREGTPPPPVKQGDLQTSAKEAGCDLQLNLKDEGNNHIKPSDPVPHYGTNPQTSGNHIVPPLQQADGAYSEFPQPVRFLHSLEHGRIEIQYSPDLSEADQLALKGVFDEAPDGMLLFPNPDMPYEVATTAWTQLMGCKTYKGAATLDAIRDFRDTYLGQGPEPVPIEFAG